DRFPTEATVIEAAFALPPARPAGPPRAGAGADREVLFGLLAVQTGLVAPSALVRAFRTWAGDRSQPVAEVLRRQGSLDSSRCALMESLILEHLKLHGGEIERSLAALSADPEMRERLERLSDPELNATLSYVRPRSTEAGSDRRDRNNALPPCETTTDGRQRVRVLRPHPRGGLGAVFVAMDTELHREVALKQILDRHADDPSSRARFLGEAEITGGLEHPGIVPVYGLGTYANGRPYYAMRFI